MSQYEPLRDHLSRQTLSEVAMTFEEIERVIGRDLPSSAFSHRAWWSNNASNNVMTRAWLGAGFRTERVDMAGHRLVFRKATSAASPSRSRTAGGREPRNGKVLFESLYGCMRGTVTVAEGVDLTAPTGEVWDAEA